MKTIPTTIFRKILNRFKINHRQQQIIIEKFEKLIEESEQKLKTKKICAMCPKSFIPYKNSQKCCSVICSSAFVTLQRKNNKSKEILMLEKELNELGN